VNRSGRHGHSAKLTGSYRRELRALFQAEIADEQGHAQFLADKIASLGGEPTTEPRPVPHANQPREMLEHALVSEKQAIVNYTERLRQAETSGDIGLKVSLEAADADKFESIKQDLSKILEEVEKKIEELTKKLEKGNDK
jgi:bacterioferritin